MSAASQHTACYFIAGNRDFLIGDQFTLETGFEVLADETVVDLYGTPTLLLHGDSMCTDDVAHMAFREDYVKNAKRKKLFLMLPISMRIKQAQAARQKSGKHKSQISMDIMDVTGATVDATFAKYNVSQMIHGHTHRQHVHTHQNDCKRYVLGDWDQTSSILTATADGFSIDNFPIVPS